MQACAGVIQWSLFIDAHSYCLQATKNPPCQNPRRWETYHTLHKPFLFVLLSAVYLSAVFILIYVFAKWSHCGESVKVYVEALLKYQAAYWQTYKATLAQLCEFVWPTFLCKKIIIFLITSSVEVQEWYTCKQVRCWDILCVVFKKNYFEA